MLTPVHLPVVLILVLVDVGLGLSPQVCINMYHSRVLILVLVDVGLGRLTATPRHWNLVRS